ncbi:Uncharacterised protein [uncultured archaeon]|nr:Uncharacterised protein [uncultured archaeon]
MTESQEYKIRRKDFLVDVTIAASTFATSRYYDVSYKNLDRLKPLKEKGFVLLPNHQSNLDIIFEGLLLDKAIRRKANYIMKNTLPSAFEYLGGIRIIRGKDLNKPISREEKKMELAKAKERRDYVLDVFYQLLAKEEIIVLHSQGNRAYKKPYEPNSSNLKKFLTVQERLNNPIQFVPLAISYENIKQPFSKVVVNVGDPIRVPNDGIEMLSAHLMNEIHLEL